MTVGRIIKQGALVAGSASPVPMTEYYVLERPLNVRSLPCFLCPHSFAWWISSFWAQDAHLFRWKFLGKLDADHKEPLSKPLIEP